MCPPLEPVRLDCEFVWWIHLDSGIRGTPVVGMENASLRGMRSSVASFIVLVTSRERGERFQERLVARHNKKIEVPDSGAGFYVFSPDPWVNKSILPTQRR